MRFARRDGMGGILEVDPVSGPVSVFVPLGPGLGCSGWRYVPALVGRFAPQAGNVSIPDSQGQAIPGPTLLTATGFELSPGSLDLPLRGYDDPANVPTVRWTYPDGSGGRPCGDLALAGDPATALTRFGRVPGWVLGSFPPPWINLIRPFGPSRFRRRVPAGSRGRNRDAAWSRRR